MPKRFKSPATYTYVKAHQEFMAQLEHNAVLVGETRDGERRLYASRLRPQAGATWCRLQVIRPQQPTSAKEAFVFHLSHNGKKWRENFDMFSMIERYPAEMAEWHKTLCNMVFAPGEIPRFRCDWPA